jgi:pilus assembly protein CpaE
MLNLRPTRTVASLAGEASIDLDLLQGYLQPHQSGVSLLAAPSELAQIVELTPETWQHTLNLLTELAHYVIVDTAAIADDVLSTVLMQADDILVVTGPEIASLYGTRRLLELLHNEKSLRTQPRLIFNQAGISGGLSAAVIEKHLNATIYASILSDPPIATYAFNRGIPFVLSHPRTQIARQVHLLAGQLLTAGAEKTQPAPQLWTKLFPFLQRA